MKLAVAADSVRAWMRANYRVRPATADELILQTCPRCGDAKWRFFFNPHKQVGYCQRNKCTATFVDLAMGKTGIERLGPLIAFLSEEGFGRVGIAAEAGETISDAFRKRLAARNAKALATPRRWPEVLKNFSCDWNTPAGKEALAYARKRNLPSWFVGSGRCGYFLRRDGIKSAWLRRLVLLTCEDDAPVYFMARAWGDAEPKMLYPPDELFGRGKSDVVFGLDLFEPGRPMLVCEGGISALSAGDGAVATLGSDLSIMQMEKMAAFRPSEVVWLREPEVPRERAHRMMRRLNVLTGIPASVADLLDGNDPNDAPEQVPEVVASRHESSRAEVIRARIADRKSP